MNTSQIKVTLEKIYDVYESLIKFVSDAEKYLVSGKCSVDFSQIATAKDELNKLVLLFKSFTDDHYILEDADLRGELSKLKGKIELYNRLKDDFVQLSVDNMQFYNDLLSVNGVFYNQSGKVKSSLPKTVLIRA